MAQLPSPPLLLAAGPRGPPPSSGWRSRTVSGQLHALEDALGEKLLARSGRRLVLTELGRVVFRYADEFFALGGELQDVLKGRPAGRPLTLTVGLADVVPKLVAARLLEPALRLAEPVHLVCREDKPDRLVAELAVHGLDVVRERFYAISVERRLKHPAVVAISEGARRELFG